MPLPTDGPLSLQGHLKLGDTEFSKPKQAMIVRLTTEMLERLESLPPGRAHESGIKVDFADNPGIYIGEEFYPTRAQPEAVPHELYMKQEKGALKLHANIVGRVLFVDRKLGEKVQSSVRERTEAAEKQRTESKIKILAAPPVLVNDKGAAAKKRKGLPEVRRANGPITARDLSVPSSSQQSRVASPRPPSSFAKSANAAHPGTRQRMIHFVALLHRTESEVHRCVGGNDLSDAEREVLSRLLAEVAVPVPMPKGSSGGPMKWQLKPESWLDVRPYEWESLEPEERTRLARSARVSLHQLRIPESDLAWTYVRLKGTESAVNAAKTARKVNGTATSTEAKRPMMSSEQRKGKAPEASGRRVTDTIIAKDEGARARAEKEKEKAAAAQSAAALPRRRLPGSGFKANSNTPTPPAVDHAQSSAAPPVQVTKRQNGADVRENKREPPASSSSSGPSRPVHPLPPPPHQQQRPGVSSSATPSATRIPKRDSDPVSRVIESDRESRRGSPAPSAALKRKKPREEGRHEPERESLIVSKRRKLAEDTERERIGSTTKTQSRESALPKKPPMTSERGTMAPPKQKLKKEPPASPSLRPTSPPPLAKRSPLLSSASPLPSMRSPLPAKPPAHQDRVPSVSSTTSHRSREEHSRHGSAKARRKSPIYTSSEDESESQPRVAIKKEDEEDGGVRPPPVSVSVSVSATMVAAALSSSELPKDLPALQRLYNKLYPEYIKLYHERIAARERIRELLAWEPGEDDEEQDREKIPCDDDEYERFRLENLREMNDRYLRLEDKLQAIQDASKSLRRGLRAGKGDRNDDANR